MSKKIVCPLRFNSTENECISNCAWNVGSEVKPMCAIEKISLNLTSIDVNNGGVDFNPDAE
ncbi:hypothetical protein [Clostridium tyrobutyricum]|jgi:hypothetical protein|uniref:hypothetical protein n=1 Tax=Clostridium tyrobutyricum TaxID=1519 RepID=UPI0010C263AA|nr:hypothetical protein [Clostridium tyrobutyricum]MBV4427115.1 hypothetical protein [Clostridium tyrobutyricum]MBV4440141.1 hypothetical protein [Clostridium tyrobutyricum]MBV4442158.1 hypothetical protein [Clostridium tyrobutyricum]MBV4442271.1 hypothetical protein [Clostridium tyrobutyricum]MBV4445341.1 hypothetical protein [Clostridium tyrobutyricum]